MADTSLRLIADFVTQVTVCITVRDASIVALYRNINAILAYYTGCHYILDSVVRVVLPLAIEYLKDYNFKIQLFRASRMDMYVQYPFSSFTEHSPNFYVVSGRKRWIPGAIVCT